MVPKLHYYNPGHETVVLNGETHYTPPANVRKLLKDLALLPVWYAEPGDYVFVEELISPRFFSTLPKELRPAVVPLSVEDIKNKATSLPRMEAAPWGISPQSQYLFNDLKDKYQLDINVHGWKEEYLPFTSRKTAAKCFEKIKSLLPDIEMPLTPIFLATLSDIEIYLSKNPGSYIIKTPYSSSGRGLLWLDNGKLNDKDRNWINGAIKKQGTVSIEPVLRKHSDFALEFYSDGNGSIEYKGISLFGTNKRGAYLGNSIEAQPLSEAWINEQIGKEKFQRIKDTVCTILQEVYSSLYKGYLGVDMLFYKNQNETIEIHPCIEINMRYTMGMAAIRIFEQYIHEKATGIFKIVYNSNPRYIYEQHQLNKKAYPITIEDGKLREGYISLCPVTKDTHYMAIIIVM